MTKIRELEKYLDYEFSSGGYTGEDYKQFEKLYISYLKVVLKDNGWELAKVNKNHYQFSAFFLCKDTYIYFSICDVRFWTNEWYKQILIRTANSEADYTGGHNNYCSLQNLPNAIKRLLEESYDY